MFRVVLLLASSSLYRDSTATNSHDMPELPEVESFRQTLLTLVGGVSETVTFECPPPLPTKRFPTQDVFDTINQGNYVMKDVLRKGKLMCIILQKKKAKKKQRSSKSKGKSDDDTNQTIAGDESIFLLLSRNTLRFSSDNLRSILISSIRFSINIFFSNMLDSLN